MLHFVGSQGLSVCWETVGRLQDSARGRGPHADGSGTRDELFIAGVMEKMANVMEKWQG